MCVFQKTLLCIRFGVLLLIRLTFSMHQFAMTIILHRAVLQDLTFCFACLTCCTELIALNFAPVRFPTRLLHSLPSPLSSSPSCLVFSFFSPLFPLLFLPPLFFLFSPLALLSFPLPSLSPALSFFVVLSPAPLSFVSLSPFLAWSSSFLFLSSASPFFSSPLLPFFPFSFFFPSPPSPFPLSFTS